MSYYTRSWLRRYQSLRFSSRWSSQRYDAWAGIGADWHGGPTSRRILFERTALNAAARLALEDVSKKMGSRFTAEPNVSPIADRLREEFRGGGILALTVHVGPNFLMPVCHYANGVPLKLTLSKHYLERPGGASLPFILVPSATAALEITRALRSKHVVQLFVDMLRDGFHAAPFGQIPVELDQVITRLGREARRTVFIAPRFKNQMTGSLELELFDVDLEDLAAARKRIEAFIKRNPAQWDFWTFRGKIVENRCCEAHSRRRAEGLPTAREGVGTVEA